MKKWILKIFYFLQLLILIQNIQFIIFYFSNYNVFYSLGSVFSAYFFFLNYLSGVILFFWSFFYLNRFRFLTILFMLNIIFEYFLVLYLVGDSF
ncbi:hypothetical protein DRF67_02430 [Chryseobacterium pennipullorum]|uniref:Uncharacterized protein n=1 Tax=Chryseobacterium pennipullorum TaxID=2258963 RepID=A0A3D9B9H2_9FLAO|nr:hypothetical protein DRF67_02430 [Chryseobacterium pennipullorum]